MILNRDRELLLCHVTGHHHWDLPKGGIDDNETPLQAALRETREETGLHLDGQTLADLGRFQYTAKKDLHLYAIVMPRFDLSALHCESQFSDRFSGRRLPEMDAFQWAGFDRVPALCTPKLSALLIGEIDLRQLLADLTTGRRGSAPNAAQNPAFTGLRQSASS